MRATLPDDIRHVFELQRQASRAQPDTPLTLRRERLLRLSKLIDEHGPALAAAVQADFGMRSPRLTEVADLFMLRAQLAHTLRHLARWCRRTRVRTPLFLLPARGWIERQPLGVVGVISPWNYPLQLSLGPAATALAAGNRVMLKPSELTPHTSAQLALLVAQFFAPDEFCVVQGDASLSALFASLPFDHLVFTGSTAVGRKVAQAAAQNLTPTTLELGGKSPCIIDGHCDMQDAALKIAHGKLLNAGQTCISTNRILVQEGIAQSFVTGLVERFKTLKVGDGFEDNVEVGPLINQSAVEHCEALLADAVSKGAKILLGGKRHALGGNFFEPTVLTGMTREMRIFHEEIFGPIAPIMTFASEAEAVELANDTPFGLASYVFTQNLSRAWRIPEALEYGLCGVNDAALALAEAPFGGVKESGTGREGGREGLLDFMETRYVLMGGIVA